jgi:hypothetical protein
MYYASRLYLKTWFGLMPPLLVIDKRLRGKIMLPENFTLIEDYVKNFKLSKHVHVASVIVVYSSLRGREYKFSWDNYLTRSSLE